MDKLVVIRNGQRVVTSLDVARDFGKRHDKLVAEIERMYPELIGKGYAQNGGDPLFEKGTYIHPQNNQRYTMYYMNRDGFSLLVMGFTGKKALEWKLKYIAAFNAMESYIRERNSAEWIEHRREGILTRKNETDVIKQLVEYAKEQGSTHSNMLYMTYTKLANKAAGVKTRELATCKQLMHIEFYEETIMNALHEGMDAGLDYKEIYQMTKERVENISQNHGTRPMIACAQ